MSQNRDMGHPGPGRSGYAAEWRKQLRFARGANNPPFAMEPQRMGHPVSRLAEGGVDFGVEGGGFEDFAGFAAVGGADEAVAFHHVDEVGGAAVAYA